MSEKECWSMRTHQETRNRLAIYSCVALDSANRARIRRVSVGGCRIFFESQDSENEGFGVVGCVQGCKTGFEAFL